MKTRPAFMLLLLVLALACCGAGCAVSGSQAGYLPSSALQDSVALLPLPPAEGSAALALDKETSLQSLALHGTARWALATEDADTSFPKAAGTFSCALDAPIDAKETPHLYRLLLRSLQDASDSTARAKRHYQRKRPFQVNGEPTCTPHDEIYLLSSGSYPSGHATAGWAWALILGEIAPDRIDAVLARGRAFGESRVICNAHWLSDVVAGRTLAAGTVALLHSDPAFRADLDAAKRELAAVRAGGRKPQRDCSAESAALASRLR
jgi:acid phosphatase (class A)